MGIRFEWQNPEKTIFLIESTGLWTLEEYYEQFLAASKEISDAGHPIVLVNDLSNSGGPPNNFLATGRFSAKHGAKNIAFAVMVSTNPFIKTLARLLARTLPGVTSNIRVVSTQQEALKIAQEEAEKLARR